ncbi:MAG: GGDEF domain-containing protein [Butyrivibrio sp.]|nr:GGDEF domain-containing protein [Acetatifactor muris]MCM1558670.1 GGDEF domain-containing protein [Butyrivibrio sp.]
MRRFVKTGYLICSSVVIVLFLFMLGTFRLDVQQREVASGYIILKDCTVETVQDNTAQLGQLLRCTFVPDGENMVDRTLAFSAYHQNVKVRIDGKTVYQMQASSGNAFGRTPGCEWIFIPISDEDLGKPVEVELEPVYKSSLEIVPDFLLGSRYDICRDEIMKALPALILAIISVVLGLAFAAYVIYNRKNTEIDRSLLMLGLFSVQVGLWKITDLDAVHILFPRNIAISYAPYFTLMLVVIPFSFFIKSLHSSSEKLGWYIPCFFCLGSAVVQLGLQLLHIADLRETLWLTHLSLFILCAVDVCLIVREIAVKGWSRRLKINVSCIAFCFLGLILDMGVYYISKGTTQTFLGLLGFTTYNVVLGVYSVKDAKALMAIGMQAKKLENKAFHDQLTGLNNRTAFAEFIAAEEFEPDKCVVIMFDLNNLKYCNDTFGHEAGDKYICESARLIRECFADLGPCYRMGGDEFCALIQGCSLRECEKRVEQIEKLAGEYNKAHQDVRIGIACGYEVYDRRIDYDINDTLRRADKMMYEKKFRMKHQN